MTGGVIVVKPPGEVKPGTSPRVVNSGLTGPVVGKSVGKRGVGVGPGTNRPGGGT